MNSQRITHITDFLRRGSFAKIPRQIGSLWIGQRDLPRAVWSFPMKIPYTSVRRGLTSDVKRTFVAVYYPLLGTVRETKDSVQLSYGWCHGGPFQIHILRELNSSRWHIFKCRKQQLLSYVVGDGYGEAMIRTTSLALCSGEPAFTFKFDATTFEEVRSENMAQIGIAQEPELGRSRSQHSTGSETLAFGLVPRGGEQGNLVFIPQLEAKRLAAIHTAIASAQTWGHFCERMPANDLLEVKANIIECGESLPEDSDEFHIDLIPGLTDGDWPDWPEQKMLDWLPAEFCQRYGKVESSVLNGPYLTLDITRSPEILDALECTGFELRFDEELVRKACGN